MPVRVDMRVAIGASGAPTLLPVANASQQNSPGVKSITRLAAGTYQIQLQDSYTAFLGMDASLESPITGGAITAGSFVATTVYEIITVGTTNYNAIGLPANVVAAPGQIFVASGVGSGTGTVKAIGVSGIDHVEVIGNPNSMLKVSSPSPSGCYINLQCIDAGSVADPASGSVLDIRLLFNNSSVQ